MAVVVTGGAVLGLVACSDDDASDPTAATTATTVEAGSATSAPSTLTPATNPTTAPAPTTATSATTVTTATTVPPDAGGFDLTAAVAMLASDELAGRDEGTDGWRMAQEYLAEQLAAVAEPAFAGREGAAGYVAEGRSANVVGIIRGTELPDEYVLVGAHYDGLGDTAVAPGGCRVLDPDDTICNGAADNAAGVAVVLAIADEVARSGPPRRSLVIALWDREEDGLLGSADYLTAPVVPADRIVASLNFDIQGANLLPSLRTTTIMVGAETGGAPLVVAAREATAASTLRTEALSLVFGQGRSDHATFVGAGIPTVFFTDATNGCYHTTRDDVTTLDVGKLEQQAATAVALTFDLLATDEVPVFVPDAPIATYADAVAMLELTSTGAADVALLDPAARTTYEAYVTELERIVGEGEAAFDAADVGPLLGGAAGLVETLANLECDGYLGSGT